MTMLSPDVDIAVELVRRAEIDSWGSLTEDLMSSAPRIHQSNAQRADDLVAWLAPYADTQPSMVQAAVANFARVLADFLLVLHYDLEVDSPYLRVPKWYRQEPRSARAGRVGHSRHAAVCATSQARPKFWIRATASSDRCPMECSAAALRWTAGVGSVERYGVRGVLVAGGRPRQRIALLLIESDLGMRRISAASRCLPGGGQLDRVWGVEVGGGGDLLPRSRLV
jgi:hypothetical protein